MKADTVKIILSGIGIAVIIGVSATAFALRSSNHASKQALHAALVAKAAATEAHRGLCTLKEGYVKQLTDTEKALNAPPGSDLARTVDAIGRKVIQNSVNGLQKRVDDLKDVKCP